MLSEQEVKALVADVLAGLGYQVGVSGGPPSAGPAVVSTPAVACVPDDGPRPPRPAYRNPTAMQEMLSTTPARIGIGRAGARYDTASWLKFRMDHAAARDAIFHAVNPEFLSRLSPVVVQTRVTDRHTYLVRPDLGRRLDAASEQTVRQRCTAGARIQLLVVDGLSGTAVEKNALDFLRAFQDACRVEGLEVPGRPLFGTPIFVQQGRVAIMDHIGEILQPELIVELVGERPGLVTAESMSAYFCYRPHLKSIESDRTLISNIHRGGIPPVEAGAHAAKLAARILAAQVSGVKLGLQP